MKKNIHPAYNSQIKIGCACGASFVAGSTAKEVKVEICSQCHPFYTGKQKLVDSAGRVDKFMAKRKKAEDSKATGLTQKKKLKKSKKSIVEYVDMEENFKAETEKKKPVKKDSVKKDKKAESAAAA